MKSSTRDKAEGTFHELKGKVKESLGKLTGSRQLESAGVDERLVGEAQRKMGQVKQVLGS